MKRAYEDQQELRADIAGDVFLALSNDPAHESARDLAVQVILEGPCLSEEN